MTVVDDKKDGVAIKKQPSAPQLSVKREALSDAQRIAAAQALAARGLPFDITRNTIVAGYSPIRSEIDPVPLMRKLAAQRRCNWRCR